MNQKKENFNSVSNPKHYAAFTIEVIEAVESWGLGFHLGNVIKYCVRAGRKDPTKELEDLKKAAWYLDRKIKQIEKNNLGLK